VILRKKLFEGRAVSISIRTIATFAIAIFLGVVAVILTRSYLSAVGQNDVARPAAVAGSVPVVVAAQSLDRGVMLEPRMLKLVDFPANSVPSNAFHRIEDLTGGKDQERLALRPLVENEPILAPNVSGPGGKLNLSGTIAAGMRAVSLRSSDVTGVGGFVLPGDRVDVLLTRVTGSGNDTNTSVTQVLAENVRVLGVDQSDNEQDDKPVVSKAITVEVTPDQAQSISLGQTVGTISLTLRHVADDTPLTRKSTAVSDLGLAPRKAVRAKAPAGLAVRVVRGTESSRFSMSAAGGFESASAAAPAGSKTP
jgi:pilus assembly protein CpaB